MSSGLTPRVVAAVAFIIFISIAVAVEKWWQNGFEFLVVVTLWVALLNTARFHAKFPENDE